MRGGTLANVVRYPEFTIITIMLIDKIDNKYKSPAIAGPIERGAIQRKEWPKNQPPFFLCSPDCPLSVMKKCV